MLVLQRYAALYLWKYWGLNIDKRSHKTTWHKTVLACRLRSEKLCSLPVFDELWRWLILDGKYGDSLCILRSKGCELLTGDLCVEHCEHIDFGTGIPDRYSGFIKIETAEQQMSVFLYPALQLFALYRAEMKRASANSLQIERYCSPAFSFFWSPPFASIGGRIEKKPLFVRLFNHYPVSCISLKKDLFCI